MQWLKIKRLDKSLPLPKYESSGAAGIDLYSTETFYIDYGYQRLVNTGISVQIPDGYVGVIKSRSSLASKGVQVQAGVIDSDYRGEIKVLLNHTALLEDALWIEKGQCMAQLLIIPCSHVAIEEVDKLKETVRGEKGFGSSGI